MGSVAPPPLPRRRAHDARHRCLVRIPLSRSSPLFIARHGAVRSQRQPAPLRPAQSGAGHPSTLTRGRPGAQEVGGKAPGGDSYPTPVVNEDWGGSWTSSAPRARRSRAAYAPGFRGARLPPLRPLGRDGAVLCPGLVHRACLPLDSSKEIGRVRAPGGRTARPLEDMARSSAFLGIECDRAVPDIPCPTRGGASHDQMDLGDDERAAELGLFRGRNVERRYHCIDGNSDVDARYHLAG
jgi:hypothetical protein